MSESSNPNFGGVHSFYNEKNKEFTFLYPEITGYYASTMRFLYEHEKNEKYVNFAKASCNWLINLYENFGGIIQGVSPQGIPKKSSKFRNCKHLKKNCIMKISTTWK